MHARSMVQRAGGVALVLFFYGSASGWAAPANPALAATGARAPLTRAAYDAARTAIVRQYEVDRKACGRLQGRAEDVCEVQAKGRRDAERARLEARYQPSPDATAQAKGATAQANYRVAREKCEALAGKAEDQCVGAAKAAREAALRQARVEKVDSTGGLFGRNAAGREPPALPGS